VLPELKDISVCADLLSITARTYESSTCEEGT